MPPVGAAVTFGLQKCPKNVPRFDVPIKTNVPLLQQFTYRITAEGSNSAHRS